MPHTNVRLVKLGLLIALCCLIGNFSHVIASESCSATLWVVVPPVEGKCPKGSSLPNTCQSPTLHPSKCSCLKQETIQTPCLTFPVPH